MNFVNLPCPMQVDGKNDIVLRPDFSFPTFKVEDTNILLDLYSHPFPVLNLNAGISLQFKRALEAKKNKWQAALMLDKLAPRKQNTNNLYIYTWDEEN